MSLSRLLCALRIQQTHWALRCVCFTSASNCAQDAVDAMNAMCSPGTCTPGCLVQLQSLSGSCPSVMTDPANQPILLACAAQAATMANGGEANCADSAPAQQMLADCADRTCSEDCQTSVSTIAISCSNAITTANQTLFTACQGTALQMAQAAAGTDPNCTSGDYVQALLAIGDAITCCAPLSLWPVFQSEREEGVSRLT